MTKITIRQPTGMYAYVEWEMESGDARKHTAQAVAALQKLFPQGGESEQRSQGSTGAPAGKVTVEGTLTQDPEWKPGVGRSGVGEFNIKITEISETLSAKYITVGVWGKPGEDAVMQINDGDAITAVGEVDSYRSKAGKTYYTLKGSEITSPEIKEDEPDNGPPDYGPEDDIPF